MVEFQSKLDGPFVFNTLLFKKDTSGAPYPYRKAKETHELIFSWLS